MHKKDTAQLPRVLFQSSSEALRQSFQMTFADDFDIEWSSNDESTLSLLQATESANKGDLDIENEASHASDSFVCLFLEMDASAVMEQSCLLQSSHPRVLATPIIVLARDFGIHSLSTLLEHPQVFRCYEHYFDAPRVLSDVYSLIFNLNETRDQHSNKWDGTSELDLNSVLAKESSIGVLVVDDESLATKYLIKQLALIDTQLKLFSACSADEALGVIHDKNNAIGIVICDQRMPGKKGKELLNDIKLSEPAIVRILTSAYAEVDVALDAINEGRIYRYLKKPWDATEIYSLIQEAKHVYCSNLMHERQKSEYIQERWREICEIRKKRLFQLFAREFSRLADKKQIVQFFTFLMTFDNLSCNQSAIKASEETSLENDLYYSFKNVISEQYQFFLHLGELSVAERMAVARSVILYFGNQNEDTLVVDDERSEPRSADRTNVTGGHPLADNNIQDQLFHFLVESIESLLQSSGLTHAAIVVHVEGENLSLENSPDKPFLLFKHLLSPLSTNQLSFVKQQIQLAGLFLMQNYLTNLSFVELGDGFSIQLWVDDQKHNEAASE